MRINLNSLELSNAAQGEVKRTGNSNSRFVADTVAAQATNEQGRRETSWPGVMTGN